MTRKPRHKLDDMPAFTGSAFAACVGRKPNLPPCKHPMLEGAVLCWKDGLFAFVMTSGSDCGKKHACKKVPRNKKNTHAVARDALVHSVVYKLNRNVLNLYQKSLGLLEL